MPTKQIRLILKILCLGSVLGTFLVLTWFCFGPIEIPNFKEISITRSDSTQEVVRSSLTLDDFEITLRKQLQYPIGEFQFAMNEMDVVTEVSTRVRTKIIATIIEPGRKAALFSTGGKLQVCRAGEIIEAAQAEVISVDAEAVVLKYPDGLITLDPPQTSPSNSH